MRLRQFEIDTINNLARKHFGPGTTVFLFGSRTDDRKKGGDIDLLIKSSNYQLLSLEEKVSFLADLKGIIGNRKIDVVFDNENLRHKMNFYRSIVNQQIRL
jgi:predicted nucleotidyltransferase